MGVYASYDDVIHPTTRSDLAEECTACRNTGWVAYPVNVGVDYNEYDPCPHGCEQMDDNTRLDYYVREVGVPIPDWDNDSWKGLGTNPLGAWASSLRPEQGADPFFILSNTRGELIFHEGGRDLVPGFGRMGRLHPKGDITTDQPAEGWIDSAETAFVVVPPYLVGTPTKVEPTRLFVRYEYLGAFIDIVFPHWEMAKFRFAYQWEEPYSTAELLR